MPVASRCQISCIPAPTWSHAPRFLRSSPGGRKGVLIISYQIGAEDGVEISVVQNTHTHTQPEQNRRKQAHTTHKHCQTVRPPGEEPVLEPSSTLRKTSTAVPSCLKTTTIVPVPKTQAVRCFNYFCLVVRAPVVMKRGLFCLTSRPQIRLASGSPAV